MKAKELWIARATAAFLIGGSVAAVHLAPEASAQVAFSAGIQINSPSDFYGPLSAYGTWVNAGPYGRCWRPINVARDWRPYEIGHWEWTDCGWYWASDDPWAWACYHYGSWELDPTYGWVWIPATEWAPAWVVWREAPDYIGWAPCGPGGVAVADSQFMFVDVHHFHDRLEPREFVFNNPDVFRRSHSVGGFRRESRDFDGVRRQIAFNQGPGIAPIQRATGTRFTPRPVTELVRQTPVPENARRELSRSRAGTPEVTRDQQRERRAPQQQQRLYREAPATQPAPTGRQQERIYREPQAQQPTPQAPREVPRREPTTPPVTPRQVPQAPAQTVPRRQSPEASVPVVPRAQPSVPQGFERGRSEQQVPRQEEQVPRREESAPKAAPAPKPAERQPVAPPPAARPERERQKDQPGD